jgi:hypothetical protein
MAMIMPISTNTTIAACSQIQVGAIPAKPNAGRRSGWSMIWAGDDLGGGGSGGPTISMAEDSGTMIRAGDYSALRKSAMTVSSTIFKSNPSDQWAM